VIQRASERMKVDHPIRVDARRVDDPPGGRWSALDAQDGGRVRLVDAPRDANRQAQLVAGEIARIRRLDAATKLGDIAVLARTHESLEPLRALCEIDGIRCAMARDAASGVPPIRTREGRRTLDLVLRYRRPLLQVALLVRWLRKRLRAQPGNAVWQDLCAAGLDLMLAYPQASLPLREIADWLYESGDAARRDDAADALRLMTGHRAKGLEFRHVIVMDCGDWGRGGDARRRGDVAVTRAQVTLSVFRSERFWTTCTRSTRSSRFGPRWSRIPGRSWRRATGCWRRPTSISASRAGIRRRIGCMPTWRPSSRAIRYESSTAC
jgi:ATP-dependent DNA helicase RecQ